MTLLTLWTTVTVEDLCCWILVTNLVSDQFDDPVEGDGIEDGVAVSVAGGVWIWNQNENTKLLQLQFLVYVEKTVYGFLIHSYVQ